METYKHISDVFKDEFEIHELPYGLDSGHEVFENGNLKLYVDFNPEYFNFFPRVQIKAFGQKIYSFGESFGNRYIYDKDITEDNIIEVLEEAENLVKELGKYTEQLSLDTLDDEKVDKYLKITFTKYNFTNE